ncbi:MAG: flagellar protein FliS [Butyrivibrio sp.]|nr:flagellar protein FliS [Acetatifactor muris]MCM1559520.1 flagellar protein FliS [Butyrivibrio sp.]
MTDREKRDFTLRISQANSTQMVVILYEMLLCNIRDGRTALEQENEEEFHGAIRRARGCVGELMNSLHLQYEPAPALLSLYGFCIRRLAAAESGKRALPLEETERVIRPLRDAYEQIAGQNSAGAVMGNSQTVYAGLTYGRNSLTENMADQGANRGMYV